MDADERLLRSCHARHPSCSKYCLYLVRSSRLALSWAYEGWAEGRPQVKRALATLSGDFGSGCAGWPAACLAFPAGVGVEGSGAEGLEPGEQFAQPPVVVDPGCVVAVLVGVSQRPMVLAAILRVHCQ
jgi:hypothetical protein